MVVDVKCSLLYIPLLSLGMLEVGICSLQIGRSVLSRYVYGLDPS